MRTPPAPSHSDCRAYGINMTCTAVSRPARLTFILVVLSIASCDAPDLRGADSALVVGAPSRDNTAVAAMHVDEDIPYAEARDWPDHLNTLDVYYRTRSTNKDKPLIVFIHGGGWNQGDKSFIGNRRNRVVPEHYTRLGYVFAAVNFRLANSSASPKATVADMAADIGAAVAWLRQHAGRYGANTDRVLLWGYSSGAHLATLLAMDDQYLGRYDLGRSVLAGVVAMDVPHYDVPLAISVLEDKQSSPYDAKRLQWLYRLFGEHPREQERFSPAAHLETARDDIAFLLLSAGHNRGRHESFSQTMTAQFQRQLQAAGIAARHFHCPTRGHTDLIRGSTDGQLSKIIAEFLDDVAD